MLGISTSCSLLAIVSTTLRPPCMNVSPPPSAAQSCGPASIYGASRSPPALQPGHAKAPPSRTLPFFMGLPPGPHRTAGQRLFSFRFLHLHTLFPVCRSRIADPYALSSCPAHPRTTHARLACISQLTLLSPYRL